MLVAAHELDVNSGSEQIYNGYDCAMTHELYSKLNLQRAEAEPAYSFERALQGPVLEMMLRGFRVDPEARHRAMQTLRERDLPRLYYIIDTLVHAITEEHINEKFINSGPQLKVLFYNILRIPEVKVWVKGELKYPMDRNVLEQIGNYFQAHPIADAILAHRDLAKQLQVLSTEVDKDWRMRTSYNIGGTKAGRFSSSTSPTGTGCVLPTTEVLTPLGWKPISAVANGTSILQWNRVTEKLEFQPCTISVFNFSGHMLQVTEKRIKQTVTPDHRVPYWDSRRKRFHVEAAKVVAANSQSNLPLSSRYEGGNLELPPYVAMLMAYFTSGTYQWRGTFKKLRKIDRFLKLAKQFKFSYKEIEAPIGYRRFVLPNYGNFPKKWGSWVLRLTAESAEGLLEEARYWDALDRGSGFIFFTSEQEQAQWFATLAHLAGRSATVRGPIVQSEVSHSDTTMWWVNVKTRRHANVLRKHWKEVKFSGKVYCPTVPSTFWLMREDGFISITGNTNLQNISEELRHIFIPDPGYTLYNVDAEQSDSRMIGYMCGLLFDDWTYLDAAESGDLHTFVARLVWPNLPWNGDLRKDRKIAETPFYRHFSHRDACKRLGHGRNFFGKAPTLSKETRVPIKNVMDFIEKYGEAFPAILKWHTWTLAELQTKKQLISIHGRKRDFFDRTNADETLRKALAFLAAAPTADNLNLGMYRVWKYMPEVQLLAQVHDSIAFQAPEYLAPRDILPRVQKLMETTLTAPNGRRFTVPTEAMTGYNWGKHVPADEARGTPEKNPKGLRKFRG
jgi:hypothetical protein